MNLKSFFLDLAAVALMFAASGAAQAHGKTAVVVSSGRNVAVVNGYNSVGFSGYGYNNFAFRFAYPYVPTVPVAVAPVAYVAPVTYAAPVTCAAPAYSQVAVSPVAFQSYAPAAYPAPVATPVVATQMQYQAPAPVAVPVYAAPVAPVYGCSGFGFSGYNGFGGYGYGHGVGFNGFGSRTVIIRR